MGCAGQAYHQEMDDLERKMEELDLSRGFTDDAVGRALCNEALSLLRSAGDGDRDAVLTIARDAATYARIVFMRSAFDRDADLDLWFAFPQVGISAMADMMRAERARWSVEDDAAEDIDEYEARDREESGFYGRTLPYDPQDDHWIFIRFGSIPKEGRSRFGLAGEDTEDGVDAWRQELGGMTHEAGVSVFKAYRHPSFHGHYVLIEPHFQMARYDVSDPTEYLLAVMGGRDAPNKAIRVDGSLKTIRAMDGTTRIELGSDGEYLIDAFKPHSIFDIGLDVVWINERTPLSSLVKPAAGPRGLLRENVSLAPR